MTLRQFVTKTDHRPQRRNNEDAFVREPPLFAIADGMGGAQAGEVASGLAADGAPGGRGRDGERRGARQGADPGREPPRLRARAARTRRSRAWARR